MNTTDLGALERSRILREVVQELKARQFAVASRHHAHHDTSGRIVCSCGFHSYVNRDLTEHILDELHLSDLAEGESHA